MSNNEAAIIRLDKYIHILEMQLQDKDVQNAELRQAKEKAEAEVAELKKWSCTLCRQLNITRLCKDTRAEGVNYCVAYAEKDGEG